MIKKIVVLIFVIAVAYLGLSQINNRDAAVTEIKRDIKHAVNEIPGVAEKPQNTSVPEKVLHQVPFTVQAPFAEWSNPEFEYGCEEASLLMAMKWAQNDLSTITPEYAKSEILKIAQFEKDLLGVSLDTSAADTVKWAKDYYNYDKIRLSEDVSVESIKKELAAGGVLAISMDGRKLGNPYFRQPGPLTHMVLVIGYDQKNKEFITNDPGTKRGQSYVYDYDVLVGAARDYPTGQHEPITKVEKKMIVISK